MKENKKSMTKAEAFEYLKGKKVYVNSHSAHIQATLFEAGYTWSSGSRNIDNEDMPFLLTTNHGEFFTICNMRDFAKADYEEISAEDVLSLEIVEEKYELEFNYDKVVELAKPLMHYLNEVGCPDGIRVSQLGIVHEPMSTLIFDNGIGRIE